MDTPRAIRQNSSISDSDLLRAGSTGKAKDPEVASRKLQPPIQILSTMVVACVGSGTYSYAHSFGPIGYIPSFAVGIVTLAASMASALLIARATGNYSLPFDVVCVEHLGKFISQLGLLVGALLLWCVCMALMILLSSLWQKLVFQWFTSETLSYWLGLIVSTIISLLMTCFISNTGILVRIVSFSFISILYSIFALIYSAVSKGTPLTRECAAQLFLHPEMAPAFSGGHSALVQCGSILSVTGLFASSLFIHNGLDTYHAQNRGPLSQRPLITCLALLGGVCVNFINGFSGMSIYACNPTETPDNLIASLSGAVGIIAQVLFLIQCTCSFPVFVAVVRAATVDRFQWKRKGEGGFFGIGGRKRRVAPPQESEATAVSMLVTHNAGSESAEQSSISTTEDGKDEMLDQEPAGACDSDTEAALQIVREDMERNAEVRPSMLATLTANLVLVATCVLIAALRVPLSAVLKYAGAVSGFLYVYSMPTIYWFVVWFKKKQFPIHWTIAAAFTFAFGLVSLIGIFFPSL